MDVNKFFLNISYQVSLLMSFLLLAMTWYFIYLTRSRLNMSVFSFMFFTRLEDMHLTLNMKLTAVVF